MAWITMKRISVFLAIFLFGASALATQAHMMTLRGVPEDDHTAREEAEGKEIWARFRAKQISCKDLSEEDFGALGEYFMGTMVGQSHAAMNAMMEQMMGEEGEVAMHISIGKRFSGCNPRAPYPAAGHGILSTMQMMQGGWGHAFGTMMYPFPGWGLIGWGVAAPFWLLQF